MKNFIAAIVLFVFIVSFVFAAIYDNIFHRKSSKDATDEPFSDDYY